LTTGFNRTTFSKQSRGSYQIFW